MKCFMEAISPLLSIPMVHSFPIVPARYGSSPPDSALRPPLGSRCMSMHGPSALVSPNAQNSTPQATPTSRIVARSQLAASAQPVGKEDAVVFNICPRTPCGPSIIRNPGMLSRPLSGVSPNALLRSWSISSWSDMSLM